MKLVLVESPTKARKLSSYLGHGFVVRASLGHIRDLPKSKMGIDIQHGYKPEYLIPKEKAKVVKELTTLSHDADEIIIATDPDREGEAIGWHLKEILSQNNKKKTKKLEFVRATFHEITKAAILDAINHPSKLNMHLVDAQQARRVLDRLVGYTVSPVLWKKIRYGLSAGRVQSVALRLIVEREVEIENFKPDEYWELDVLLNTEVTEGKAEKAIAAFKENKPENLPKSMFVARVVEVHGKAYAPTAEKDVTPVLTLLDKAKYSVNSVEKKERTRVSLPPFTTSTLQQQAATRLGYTSKNTMRLAQQLYEEGVITYHRTDSVNLSTQSLDMARAYIQEQYGPSYLPAQPRYFATKTKNAQEAHEAIRPTEAIMTVERVKEECSGLTDQHLKLYDLIWRRFLASQMESAVYDQTSVLVDATAGQQDAVLKASGSVLKFDGWMKLFPNQGDSMLPPVEPKQDLHFVTANSAQKFTQPPPRYNDASLIKTLEQEGIGRPSTYASIISVIEDRGYVERKEKKFFPTAIGRAVSDFLMKYFMEIMDYKFTANMEDDLDAIARGEKEWEKIIGEFYVPFEKNVEKVVDKAERAQIPVEKTGEPCPKCGPTEKGEIVIRTGRYGKFKSCSRFPECDFTENIVNKVEGVVCPVCQEGEVIIKPTRYGRDFYSCSKYPECDWASWGKPAPGTKISAAQWKKMKAEREERRKAREKAMGKTEKDITTKKPEKKSKTKK